jgi:hypothetical protein
MLSTVSVNRFLITVYFNNFFSLIIFIVMLSNVSLTARIHTLSEVKKSVFDLDENKQVKIDPTTGAQMQKEVVTGTVARADVMIGEKKVGDLLISMDMLKKEEAEFFAGKFTKPLTLNFGG